MRKSRLPARWPQAPVEDIYTEGKTARLRWTKLPVLAEGADVALIACGEMVRPALDAAALLKAQGISATVLDMYCVKPLDNAAVIKAAQNAKVIVTVEEHAPFGGLGSMVAQAVGEHCPRKVKNLSLPDDPRYYRHIQRGVRLLRPECGGHCQDSRRTAERVNRDGTVYSIHRPKHPRHERRCCLMRRAA